MEKNYFAKQAIKEAVNSHWFKRLKKIKDKTSPRTSIYRNSYF